MNSAATAPSRVRPRRRGVFLAVRRPRAARRSSARGANANPAAQILSLVRRVGRLSPWGAFLCGGKSFRSCAMSGGLRRGEPSRVGANLFARAPCREAFAEGRVPARGNPFARAPCREAFAEGRVPARGKFFCSSAVSGCLCRGACSCAGKSFRSCAVSGGFRRGEPSRAGQILSPSRRVGKPSPRRAFPAGQILPTASRHRKTVARHRNPTPRCALTCGRGGFSARPRRA